jgi:heme-degrading monooxygenase HmoA
MFARLTYMDIKVERIDEAVKIFEKSVVPAAKSQKGFIAAYYLVDQKIGKTIAITFWKSEEDAVANERNLYYQENLAKFIPLFQSNPIREGYEVNVKAKV